MNAYDVGCNLYSRYTAGDSDALRELIEHYAPSLLLFINRYVNNLSVAEELMEDTFCDLVIKKHHFKGEGSFKTYLFAIGRHKAADYMRRRSKYGFEPIEDIEAELRDIRSLEEMVLKEEQEKALWRAMDDINDDYRSVLYLFYFEELSYDEISKILKKSKSQIKNLVYRARQSLKVQLERGGFVYEEL